MNPTAIGILSILVWGIALPFVRIFEDRIGSVAYLGFMFAGMGVAGMIRHAVRGPPFPRAIFRNPLLYGRWLFFVLHASLLMSAIAIVKKEHMPFLILVNYLWPTAIIVCSVLLAGVTITRWWSFLLGSVVVIASMATEICGPAGLSADLFAAPADRLAYGMTFAGAVSWGLYSALSRRAGDATGGSTVMPLFQLTLATLLPVSFIPGMATWGNIGPLGITVLAGYCFLEYLAYQGWDYGMRRGNVIILSLCADFIPWLSLIATGIMLGVDIGGSTVVSAVSLVIGAIITRYGTLGTAIPPLFEMPER